MQQFYLKRRRSRSRKVQAVPLAVLWHLFANIPRDSDSFSNKAHQDVIMALSGIHRIISSAQPKCSNHSIQGISVCSCY